MAAYKIIFAHHGQKGSVGERRGRGTATENGLFQAGLLIEIKENGLTESNVTWGSIQGEESTKDQGTRNPGYLPPSPPPPTPPPRHPFVLWTLRREPPPLAHPLPSRPRHDRHDSRPVPSSALPPLRRALDARTTHYRGLPGRPLSFLLHDDPDDPHAGQDPSVARPARGGTPALLR